MHTSFSSQNQLKFKAIVLNLLLKFNMSVYVWQADIKSFCPLHMSGQDLVATCTELPVWRVVSGAYSTPPEWKPQSTNIILHLSWTSKYLQVPILKNLFCDLHLYFIYVSQKLLLGELLWCRRTKIIWAVLS